MLHNVVITSANTCFLLYRRYLPSPTDPSPPCVPGRVFNRSPMWKENWVLGVALYFYSPWQPGMCKSQTGGSLALFRGSCVWVEEKDPGTQFVHAHFPQDFWEFGNSVKSAVKLTSARHADFPHIKDGCHWPHSVWKMTRERQRYSALHLQELSTLLSILAKCWSTWLMRSSPLMFTPISSN